MKQAARDSTLHIVSGYGLVRYIRKVRIYTYTINISITHPVALGYSESN